MLTTQDISKIINKMVTLKPILICSSSLFHIKVHYLSSIPFIKIHKFSCNKDIAPSNGKKHPITPLHGARNISMSVSKTIKYV